MRNVYNNCIDRTDESKFAKTNQEKTMKRTILIAEDNRQLSDTMKAYL